VGYFDPPAPGGLLDTLESPFDAAGAVVTGAAGGLAGLVRQGWGQLMTGETPGESKRAADALSDTLTVQPKTHWGKKAMEALGYAMNPPAVQQLVKPVDDWFTQQAGSPENYGLLAGIAGMAMPGPKGVRAATIGERAAPLRSLLTQTPDELKAANAQPMFDYSLLSQDPGRVREIPRYDPPRGVPQREQRLLTNEDAYQRLKGWAQQGMTEDGVGWYNMEQLRKEFVTELGADKGNAQFDKYIDLVGATSAGAKTDANLKIASHYYVRDAQGLPTELPAKGSGYGHKAQQLHFRNAADILSGGGLDPIENPKRYTFAENLKGNQQYATVDTHNVRAMGIASQDPEWIGVRLADEKGASRPDFVDPADWDPKSFNPRAYVAEHNVPWEQIPPQWFESAPKKTAYLALEGMNKRLAADLGLTPAQAQAALWLGAGKVTGLGSKPLALMKVLDDRLGKTGNARGISKAQALKELIQGKHTLLQLGGATAAGGLLAQGANDDGGT
jgi:hypothetical protein